MDTVVIRGAGPGAIDELVAIDDDASRLFPSVGLDADLGPEHPYSRGERARWLRAAAEGTAFLAGPRGSPALGMLVLDHVAGACHVEQLSVRVAAMRRGIGGALLRHAVAWAAGQPLWLTTYMHVPWNRPFYERAGFVVVPEARCPAWIVAILEDERRWLPAPGERVAMCHAPAT